MNKNNKNTFKACARGLKLVPAALLLTSCAATQTAIEHRNLETSTRLSETIFLDPVSASQKSIYVSVKNTSEETVSVEPELKEVLRTKGYKIVSNPDNAHYWLQANILKVGKMSKSASQSALGGGYGSALAGAGTGAAVGALSGYSNATLAGGLAGGIVGLAADSLVKNVDYTMITDIQISEKTGKGVKVQEAFHSSLNEGSASNTTQHLSKQSQYMRYRIRAVSDANQVNLSFAKARPVLEQGLVKTLAGIF